MHHLLRLALSLSYLISMLVIAPATWAAMLNLHENPDDTSKVTGTVDLSAGIIPIYAPKESVWVKVGNPANGATGWVKSSDLKDSQGNKISFSQSVTDKGNNSQSVQMTSGNQPLTPEQQKQLELQQKTAQESLMKAQQGVNQALTEIQKAYQQQMEVIKKTGFPMITIPPGTTQPVVVQPIINQPSANPATTTTAPAVKP